MFGVCHIHLICEGRESQRMLAACSRALTKNRVYHKWTIDVWGGASRVATIRTFFVRSAVQQG